MNEGNCKWGLIGVLSNCQGPIKDTKRTRGRLVRNVAPCSRPITTVIGPLHECKKVCPCTKALPPSGSRMNQARSRGQRLEKGTITSSMQQADYHRHRPTPWMQESVSMHKSPTPLRQSHESSKVGRRGKREEERQERQRPGGWWKERQPTKPNTSEELKQGLPT